MGWQPDYATLTELKRYISPGIADTVDDAELSLALSAASRAIDRACARQFGKIEAEDEPVARYFGPDSAGRQRVLIEDLATLVDLAIDVDTDGDGTYSTSLTLDTDCRLYPWNAQVDGRPWTMLVAANPGGTPFSGSGPFGAGWWPARHDLSRVVRVTARWGWAAVPAVVKQACLLQASRIFKRKDAPFGIAGSPEVGGELRLLERLDPDVAVLLVGLKRHRVWAA